MIGMIAAVIEAAVILWLLLDRRHMIRALSERRRDIRVLKRMLKSERMRNDETD